MYWSAAEVADVPRVVTTVMSTVPAVRAGAVARIEVADKTVKDAFVVPKRTAVTFVNPEPVIVTAVPPLVGPIVGEMPVTVGNATYVNRSAGDVADVPPSATTVTSTAPAEPGGAVALIDVADSTVNVADAAPKRTSVTLVKPVPVIVTLVPPVSGPCVGLMADTIGGAT